MALTIYKKEQGLGTRLTAFLSCEGMLLWGVNNLYEVFPLEHSVYGSLYHTRLIGVEINLTYMTLICAAVFLLFSALIFWFFNRQKPADFLIETEGELKKVSWPAGHEFIGASIAVMVVILFTTIYLYLVDYGLSRLLLAFRIGF